MDFIFPGFIPPEFGENGPWWFTFHQTPNLPESIVEGKERQYLSWFFKGLTYNPEAITDEEIDRYVSYYSSPGGMRAGFEYYRAFSQDAEDNKESAAKGKITMPVLVLSGDIYPALGGDFPGSTTLNSTQALAENVQGVIVPLQDTGFQKSSQTLYLTSYPNSLGIILMVLNKSTDSLKS